MLFTSFSRVTAVVHISSLQIQFTQNHTSSKKCWFTSLPGVTGVVHISFLQTLLTTIHISSNKCFTFAPLKSLRLTHFTPNISHRLRATVHRNNLRKFIRSWTVCRNFRTVHTEEFTQTRMPPPVIISQLGLSECPFHTDLCEGLGVTLSKLFIKVRQCPTKPTYDPCRWPQCWKTP